MLSELMFHLFWLLMEAFDPEEEVEKAVDWPSFANTMTEHDRFFKLFPHQS